MLEDARCSTKRSFTKRHFPAYEAPSNCFMVQASSWLSQTGRTPRKTTYLSSFRLLFMHVSSLPQKSFPSLVCIFPAAILLVHSKHQFRLTILLIHMCDVYVFFTCVRTSSLFPTAYKLLTIYCSTYVFLTSLMSVSCPSRWISSMLFVLLSYL